ncbi:hypothetical protein TNCV_1378741 [Trichonephila clavipes]|nr:hypothetical protein TNCV_1378741 [Trichonephila clavipes]
MSSHSQWCVNWQEVVFSDEFNCCLDFNDGRVLVKRYGDCRLPKCFIKRHTGPTSGVRSGLLLVTMRDPTCFGSLVKCIQNRGHYIREVDEPDAHTTLLQNIPGAMFQQDNAYSFIIQNLQAFFSI